METIQNLMLSDFFLVRIEMRYCLNSSHTFQVSLAFLFIAKVCGRLTYDFNLGVFTNFYEVFLLLRWRSMDGGRRKRDTFSGRDSGGQLFVCLF